mgnify:CR=1 FL=1
MSAPAPQATRQGTGRWTELVLVLVATVIAVGAYVSVGLGTGGDLPQLKFTEWNCVQCGLCEKACPEEAISMVDE